MAEKIDNLNKLHELAKDVGLIPIGLHKKKSIDNIDLLLPFVNPTSDDDFYYLQILQRKKENPHLGRNSRVIKNYYIKSKDELLKKYDEIKELCEVFNARASLRLNKRSFRLVAFKALENMAHNMSQSDYINIPHGYDRACGLGHNDTQNKWILDIDDKEPSDKLVHEMTSIIDSFLPHTGQSKVLAVIPSKTGFHLITNHFDSRTFKQYYPDVEIHRDNPTSLYIPSS